jgi:hypothetical protein
MESVQKGIKAGVKLLAGENQYATSDAGRPADISDDPASQQAD